MEYFIKYYLILFKYHLHRIMDKTMIKINFKMEIFFILKIIDFGINKSKLRKLELKLK